MKSLASEVATCKIIVSLHSGNFTVEQRVSTSTLKTLDLSPISVLSCCMDMVLVLEQEQEHTRLCILYSPILPTPHILLPNQSVLK